jgi:WD40 repeat protein
VRLWHVETRKVDRQFQAVPEAERKQSHHVWRTALSPDGKTMAVAYDDFRGGGGLGFRNAPHLVRLWDVASGRETHTLYGHGHYVLSLAFSPDGQLLITAGEGRSQVFVWDAITGKRVAAVPDGLPIGASAVAFSPDGRFLATALPEGAIRLWEVATWTARNEYQGHRDRPTALTFAPGGRLLSGSLDTTVLAWDIRPPRVAGTGSLETAWIDLAEHESSDAFQSMGRFLAVPSEAVKFFADQIKSVAAPDVKHIQKLLAALDSDEFSERESASKTLADLGQQAKPFVEEVAKTTRSAEVRTRTGKILEGLQKKTPEEIRQLRMVLTLELIDEDGSRNLLKKWTVGRHGALLAEEAAAALKRLESAAKAKR